MKYLVVLAMLASASASYADSVASTNFTPDFSATRDFKRGGRIGSEWKSPATDGNTSDHQGRGVGTFEDGGQGMVKFKVKADADGKAVVGFQDVGDTKHFKSFLVNGEKIDVPAPGKNGGVLRVALDFGKAGWHKVVAITRLNTSRSGAQDGFSVCRR